jgi:AP-1 complex subunit mu
MVLSALFIMDMKGKVIVCRNYRGDIPIGVADKFSLHIQENDETDLRPVFTEDGITYVYIKCNNVLLLAITKRNSNITLILFFLYRLAQVFKDYFGDLEEESIRDNFVVVYELLDETMDFGYPQTCESKILRE